MGNGEFIPSLDISPFEDTLMSAGFKKKGLYAKHTAYRSRAVL